MVVNEELIRVATGEEYSEKQGKDPDYFFNDVLPLEKYPFDISFDEQAYKILEWAESLIN